jgi:Flp pilus assembly pilin Flp
MTLFERWLHDESGSDLVEYALLTATVGIMAAAALALMPGILSTIYQTWDSGTQLIWDPCDPGAASTCH